MEKYHSHSVTYGIEHYQQKPTFYLIGYSSCYCKSVIRISLNKNLIRMLLSEDKEPCGSYQLGIVQPEQNIHIQLLKAYWDCYRQDTVQLTLRKDRA
ncbi:hypothetical protein STEG23_021965, partial [Scotinomys teguina]